MTQPRNFANYVRKGEVKRLGEANQSRRWLASTGAAINPAVGRLWGDRKVCEGVWGQVGWTTGYDGEHSGGWGQQLYTCKCRNVLVLESLSAINHYSPYCSQGWRPNVVRDSFGYTVSSHTNLLLKNQGQVKAILWRSLMHHCLKSHRY